MTLSQGGVARGGPRRSPGQGLQPPILSRFPQRPGPASAQWLQCALLTAAFPFVSVSASLGISVSASLWLTLVSQHPSRAPGEQSWGGRAVGTGQRPVLTKDNEGRKGLEPRPGGPRAPGAPAPPLWRARHASALRTVRRVRPLRVEDPSCPVSPSRCPPSSPPAPGGTLPAGLHLRPSPASLTPASGAGGGCRGVSGPRVREQEETSGFSRPPGRGLRPLPEASASRVAQPQGSQGREAGTSALLTFRSPGAPVASRPLT